MKNQKGITLIALVITIIVLLILAGVAIAMLSGENGILTRASNASVDTAISTAKELVVLEVNEALTDYMDDRYVNNNGDASQKTFVENALKDDDFKAEVENDKTVTYVFNATDGTVTITSTKDKTIDVTGKVDENGNFSWDEE